MTMVKRAIRAREEVDFGGQILSVDVGGNIELIKEVFLHFSVVSSDLILVLRGERSVEGITVVLDLLPVYLVLIKIKNVPV